MKRNSGWMVLSLVATFGCSSPNGNHSTGGADMRGGVGGVGGSGGSGGGGGSGGSAGGGGSDGGNAGGTDGGNSGGSDGGSGAPVNNVVPVIVDNGPNNIGSQDVPFISVTVCVPGTNTCATVDHISVDTGSTGLRIISSALPAGFALPQQKATTGNPMAECFTFADGYVWGSVRLADLKLGGETAANMQLQLVGDPVYAATVPSDCSSTGSPENTVADFGGNGIIGINQWLTDCGTDCTTVNSGFGGYYSCSGTTCTDIAMPLANQIANPVTLFANDNNGAVLQFPTVPAAGAATLSGTLTFGIGTQADNALGSAAVLTVDPSGNLTTVYKGTTMTASFIDSGTNSLSFTDSTITQCKGNDAGFYCPATTTSLTATLTGQNGTSSMVSFSVANTDTLFKNATFTAFDNLAGTGDKNSFDWGFPFFIGRTVFVAFAEPSSPGGNGYFAY